jgi:lysophospholipase L1-like esterase
MERVRPLARWAAPLGLFGVASFVVLVADTDDWLYSGGFLLIAAVSAVLLAAVVADPDGAVGRTLAWAPIVWIGRISYGLYLWHWPVYVVLSPTRTGLAGLTLLVLRFAVTFSIATASFYLVEMPIRRGALGRLTSRQRLVVVVGAPLVILGLVGFTAATGRPPAPDSLEVVRDSASRSPSPVPSSPGPATQAPVQEVRAILVGDSIALSLFAAYEPDSVAGFAVLPGTEFGCGVVPFDAALNALRMPIRAECARWDAERASRIAASGASLGVLFPGPWEQYDRWIDGQAVPYTDPRWREATIRDYEQVLNELATATSRQAVVLNTCHGAPDLDLPDAVMFQAGRYPGVVNDPGRIAAVNDAAREAVRRSGRDIPIIDPNPFLCDGDQYRPQIDGVTMHTDGVHFTEAGARLYWEWLGPRLLKAGRTPAATPSEPAP